MHVAFPIPVPDEARRTGPDGIQHQHGTALAHPVRPEEHTVTDTAADDRRILFLHLSAGVEKLTRLHVQNIEPVSLLLQCCGKSVHSPAKPLLRPSLH